MRRLIYILSITCIAFGQLAATGMYSPDERNKPGDDKKGKGKGVAGKGTTRPFSLPFFPLSFTFFYDDTCNA